MKKLILTICFCLIATTSFAVTRNVPADGTISAVWSASSAGDTIIVANGTYAGAHSPTTGTGSGADGNPIIIQAQSQYGAIVGSFSTNGATYVRFDGFEITSTGEGIAVYGAGTEILNCKFSGLATNAIQYYANAPYLKIQNCWFYQSHFCLHPKGTYYINNGIISGNRLQDLRRTATSTEADGFRFSGTGVTVSDNYSYGHSFTPNHDDFVQTAWGTGIDNSTFERNIVIGQTFIMANSTTNSTAWITGNIFRNNVHVGLVGSRGSSGFWISRGQNNEFYNNTIVNSVYGITIMDYISAGNPSATVQNNIFKNCQRPFYAEVTTDITADYNLYYLYTTAPSVAGVNDVASDPLLVNGTSPFGADGIPFNSDDGYRLTTASPARSAGTDLETDVPTDIYSANRVTPWDIGAHEFDGTSLPTPDPETPLSIAAAIEAESGESTSPMAEVADAGASGGYYVASNTENSGELMFYFAITVAGNYKILATVYATNSGDDSFLVQMDGENEFIWHLNPAGTTITYSTYDTAYITSWSIGETTPPTPHVFTLTQANHHLYIRGREANARIDKIEFESYSAPAPASVTGISIGSGGSSTTGSGGTITVQ